MTTTALQSVITMLSPCDVTYPSSSRIGAQLKEPYLESQTLVNTDLGNKPDALFRF